MRKLLHSHPASRAAAILTFFVVSLGLALAASPAAAVTITIQSTDGPDEGFNDPTAVAPVGGNPGTTLGAQRRFLFQHAADAWGLRLGGDVPIVVTASFENLGGTAVSAILGSAGPTTVHRDFVGAPVTATWYVASLANELYGADQNDQFPLDCPEPLVNGQCPEITAQFNSAVDNQTVLGSTDFYYGIDGNSGTDIDFLTIVLHEIAHGLGLLDLIDPGTGGKFYGFTDAYMNRLQDSQINPRWLSQMSDAQRLQAIVDDGMLAWNGPAMLVAGHALSAGLRPNGSVQIYAPAIYSKGSSVSHLDTDVFPDELMEPFATNPPPRNLSVTLALLADLGWTVTPLPACGHADGEAAITTADALMVLKKAVNLGQCPGYLCDVDLSGGVNTTDALLVLRSAIAQNVALKCPLA